MTEFTIIKQLHSLNRIAPRFDGYAHPSAKEPAWENEKPFFVPAKRTGDGRFFLATTAYVRKINKRIAISNGAY